MLFDAGGEGESGDLGERGEVIIAEPEERFYEVVWERFIVEDLSDRFCGEIDGFYGPVDNTCDFLATKRNADDGARS